MADATIQFIEKSTKLDRFLATYVGFFARRWQRKVQEELVEQARAEHLLARSEVDVAAAMYVFHHHEPGDEERYKKLAQAVITSERLLLRFVELSQGPDARDAVVKTLLNIRLPEECRHG